ncbi:CCR4-NOT transcription complex subunit 10-like [Clytia hemisphaerica]|uniref:CCR4-NOT transcription complex subunit 10 n=1 Tax=Clytia hemisphaerica TaxID=252671 RepID=A0A7M5WXZ1_9CNID
MPQIKQETQTREIASAHKAITDQDRQIAASASSCFKEKKYDQCSQQMKKLSEQRPHDPRVIVNKAVLDYYISNFSKTDYFMKQMQNAKKQFEFGNSGDELDDIDRCYFFYNQAVLHFYLKQYKSSLNLLDRLYKVIEPLGDLLAAKVCFLFVEVCLLNNQHDQAFGMITYIESVILAKPLDNNAKNVEFMKACQNKLRLSKARLYLVRGFYAQCKKELELAISGEHEPTEVLFLKSQVECLRCNYQKSISILHSTNKNTPSDPYKPLQTMYQNNLGCIHFLTKKYNLAVSYFKKACVENAAIMKKLQSIDKNQPLSGRPLHTLTINKRAELFFNMGLSLLYAGRPSQAFECLLQSHNVYQCNPRYWLRFAECCIAVHQETIEKEFSCVDRKNMNVYDAMGSGVNRKLVVAPTHFDQHSKSTPSTSPTNNVPTLSFGSMCLSNACTLLPSESVLEENMTKFLQNEKPVPGGAADDKESVKRSFIGRIFVDAPPGHPIQTKEIYHLRASVVCCQAYISLTIGDYYKCVEHSRSLLRMTHISGPQKFLGHSYLAESLIKLDKIAEAIQELSTDNLKAYQTFDQETLELSTVDTFPKSLGSARMVMMLNLASVYAIRAEYDKCKQILHQIALVVDMHSPIKYHAILLSAYCELQLGKITSALSLIKKHEIFPHGRLVDRVEAAARTANNPVGGQYPQNILHKFNEMTMSMNQPFVPMMQ